MGKLILRRKLTEPAPKPPKRTSEEKIRQHMAAYGASQSQMDDAVRRRAQQGLLCVNCGSRHMRSAYRDETTYAEAHSLTGAYTRFPTGVYRVRTDTCQDCGFSQEVRSTPPSPV